MIKADEISIINWEKRNRTPMYKTGALYLEILRVKRVLRGLFLMSEF